MSRLTSNIVIFVIAASGGALVMSVIMGRSSLPAPPLMLSDMRAVVAALEPFEHERSYRRASVCVFSRNKDSFGPKHTIAIEFHTGPSTEHKSGGDTLAEAIQNLHSGFVSIDAALAPFANEK